MSHDQMIDIIVLTYNNIYKHAYVYHTPLEINPNI